jgi:hypothetical protein
MVKFMPIVYAGFWLNALSGTGLFITYPVKAVTNPVFYLKLAGVVTAIVCIRTIRHQLYDTPGAARDPAAIERAKRPAATLLVVWIITITAGRLLAYKGVPAIEWMATLFMVIVSGMAVGIRFGGSPADRGPAHDGAARNSQEGRPQWRRFSGFGCRAVARAIMAQRRLGPCETLHFVGLCLSIGIVGLFDFEFWESARAWPAAIRRCCPGRAGLRAVCDRRSSGGMGANIMGDNPYDVILRDSWLQLKLLHRPRGSIWALLPHGLSRGGRRRRQECSPRSSPARPLPLIGVIVFGR